jgi:hypothetical protein
MAEPKKHIIEALLFCDAQDCKVKIDEKTWEKGVGKMKVWYDACTGNRQ